MSKIDTLESLTGFNTRVIVHLIELGLHPTLPFPRCFEFSCQLGHFAIMFVRIFFALNLIHVIVLQLNLWLNTKKSANKTTFPASTYAPYAEQFRRQSNEITAQALSVFDTSNQLAINAINAARENVKLYGKAIDAVTEFNNNVAHAWSSFFSTEQRHQYLA